MKRNAVAAAFCGTFSTIMVKGVLMVALLYPWRELYAPTNIPNWALTLVGAGGVIAACMTLRAIRKQVKLQIEAQRSWVMVEIDWQQGSHFSEGADNSGIWVNCVCLNQGKSFAQLTDMGYVFKIVHTLPKEPDFSDIHIFHHSAQYVSPDSAAAPYPLSPGCEGRLKSSNMMVLYGLVKYRDVYGEHETRFGYQITGMKNLERLPVSSYPKYNEHI